MTDATDLPVPELVSAVAVAVPGATAWQDALAANLAPGAHTAARDDVCADARTPRAPPAHRKAASTPTAA